MVVGLVTFCPFSEKVDAHLQTDSDVWMFQLLQIFKEKMTTAKKTQ